MGFDVEHLLSSKNFCLNTIRAVSYIRDSETELWQDKIGPLKLGRIGSGPSSHFRLHLDDEVAVDVHPGRRLVVLARADSPPHSIDHFLADQVVPRVMAHEGELVLHAGAVRLGDDAILLVGSSGRGKSTLATSFHLNGWPMMGDDAVTISTGEKPRAKAIYPSLRLFPDSIAALLPDGSASEDIAHYSEKQRVAVPVSPETCSESVPIRAIFVLEEPLADEVKIRRLTIADTCMAIVENSFALDPTDIQRARQRLIQASALAREVPTFGVAYPRDYSFLPFVRDTIRAKIESRMIAA